MFRELTTRIVIMAVAAFVASIGLAAMVCFLCLALYLWMCAYAPPLAAALLSAGIALLFSLIVLMIARFATATMENARKKRQAAESGLLGPALAFGALMGKEFLSLSDRSKRTAIFGSLLAGLVLGASPKLREMLRDIVR